MSRQRKQRVGVKSENRRRMKVKMRREKSVRVAGFIE
jgi:hypothetical protein